jgi:hypothetical protein
VVVAAVVSAVVRAQAVAAALVAKAPALRETTAMTAAVNSSHHGPNQLVRHKVRGVAAPQEAACHNSLRAMPMSHVSRALQRANLTQCALA